MVAISDLRKEAMGQGVVDLRVRGRQIIGRQVLERLQFAVLDRRPFVLAKTIQEEPAVAPVRRHDGPGALVLPNHFAHTNHPSLGIDRRQ